MWEFFKKLKCFLFHGQILLYRTDADFFIIKATKAGPRKYFPCLFKCECGRIIDEITPEINKRILDKKSQEKIFHENENQINKVKEYLKYYNDTYYN